MWKSYKNWENLFLYIFMHFGGTRSKSSLKTKFLNRLNVQCWVNLVSLRFHWSTQQFSTVQCKGMSLVPCISQWVDDWYASFIPVLAFHSKKARQRLWLGMVSASCSVSSSQEKVDANDGRTFFEVFTKKNKKSPWVT